MHSCSRSAKSKNNVIIVVMGFGSTILDGFSLLMNNDYDDYEDYDDYDDV